jgi:hypothetical protein
MLPIKLLEISKTSVPPTNSFDHEAALKTFIQVIMGLLSEIGQLRRSSNDLSLALFNKLEAFSKQELEKLDSQRGYFEQQTPMASETPRRSILRNFSSGISRGFGSVSSPLLGRMRNSLSTETLTSRDQLKEHQISDEVEVVDDETPVERSIAFTRESAPSTAFIKRIPSLPNVTETDTPTRPTFRNPPRKVSIASDALLSPSVYATPSQTPQRRFSNEAYPEKDSDGNCVVC